MKEKKATLVFYGEDTDKVKDFVEKTLKGVFDTTLLWDGKREVHCTLWHHDDYILLHNALCAGVLTSYTIENRE